MVAYYIYLCVPQLPVECGMYAWWISILHFKGIYFICITHWEYQILWNCHIWTSLSAFIYTCTRISIYMGNLGSLRRHYKSKNHMHYSNLLQVITTKPWWYAWKKWNDMSCIGINHYTECDANLSEKEETPYEYLFLPKNQKVS